MAEQIPGAKYVELPSNDHLPWCADAILAEIEEFLTGERHGPEPDRILATILFTDIVGSTDKAVAIGESSLAGSAGEFLRSGASGVAATSRN